MRAASRSKWGVDEIALFEEGLRIYGEHAPSAISKFMGSRSGEQVRERIRSLRRKGNTTAAAAVQATRATAGASGAAGGGGGGPT
jgi:hypothetical protein